MFLPYREKGEARTRWLRRNGRREVEVRMLFGAASTSLTITFSDYPDSRRQILYKSERTSPLMSERGTRVDAINTNQTNYATNSCTRQKNFGSNLFQTVPTVYKPHHESSVNRSNNEKKRPENLPTSSQAEGDVCTCRHSDGRLFSYRRIVTCTVPTISPLSIRT